MNPNESRLQAQPVSNEPDIDLRELARVLTRRRWIVAGTIICVMLAGTLKVIRAPRIYKSKATMLIEQSAPDVLTNVREVYDLGANSYWASKEYYETQYKVISSLPVAEKAAARLGLSPKTLAEQVRALGPTPVEAVAMDDSLLGASEQLRKKLALLGLRGDVDRETLVKRLEALDAARMLQSMVAVEPIKDSRLVSIAIEHSDAECAALFANAIADAYIEYNLDQKVEATRSAVDWLSDQMSELKDKLQKSELGLYEFKRDNNVVSVSIEERQTMIAETLSTLNKSAAEGRARLIALESRRNQLNRAREQGVSLDSIDEVVNNDLIQKLKLDYATLRQEQTDLSLKYTPEHPKLVAAGKQIELLNREVQQEIDKILDSVERQYQTALETDRRLGQAVEQVKAEALELNKKEIEYNRLKRERDNNQALYELVLKRQKEADLTQMLKVNNVRKLEAAATAREPIRPRVRIELIMSLLLGVFLGVGLAFAVDYLDNSVKTQHQIEQRVGLPFLGIIPVIKSDKAPRSAGPRERDRFIVDHPRSSVSECCRTVRTNLLFMSHGREGRCLLVTSAGPQEGKSTTAINLALTMAQSGARTVIVDTDMRRPRLHRSFGIPNDAGVSNLVLGESDLARVTHATGIENLDVIACGPIPPNPAELLHTDSFRKIVQTLSERYDRVFFDSPPVSAVADALVLSSMVSGVVLVINAGTTSWHAALASKRRLEGVGANVFGAVLNNVNLDDKRAGSYYQYYCDYYRSGDEQAEESKSA